MDCDKLSDYARRLEDKVKQRYINKISVLGGKDPFLNDNFVWSATVLPPTESTDLVNYLVLGTSYYSGQQYKAYKSLEAYNHFVSGWVGSVKGCEDNGHYVVISEVWLII